VVDPATPQPLRPIESVTAARTATAAETGDRSDGLSALFLVTA
jgi:hypothetical protein